MMPMIAVTMEQMHQRADKQQYVRPVDAYAKHVLPMFAKQKEASNQS